MNRINVFMTDFSITEFEFQKRQLFIRGRDQKAIVALNRWDSAGTNAVRSRRGKPRWVSAKSIAVLIRTTVVRVPYEG